ncbi:hypothetical protein FHS31_000854 [Sphingomonas vulcanisoli]|uniref:Holin n=1 Tax=Sphingomonas vulcanisoli TaxID=1658060 RepID=A0ABX0TNZ6_9SPHN|nr:hypothetical protein [Sphingomonas vulcanisoli]NIJ07258.1 hypothetical protein [Sphingomonas vulcanisoli]
MTNIMLASAGAAVARVGKWTLARLAEKSTYIGLAGVATALDHGEIAQHMMALGNSGPLLLGALGVVLAAATTRNPTAVIASIPTLDSAAIAVASDAGAPVPEHVHSLIESVERLVTTMAVAAPVVEAVETNAPVADVASVIAAEVPSAAPAVEAAASALSGELTAAAPAAPAAPIIQTTISSSPFPALENGL